MDHLRALLMRLGVVLLLLTLVRLLFLLVHHAAFPALSAAEGGSVLLHGARFDAMSIVVANAPLILLSLLPFPWRAAPWHARLLLVLFVLINGAVLFICCIDLPLYGFTGKRVTRDVLGMADAGLRELPVSVVRYWWATLAFVLATIMLVVGWRRVRPPVDHGRGTWARQLAVSLPALGALFLVGRGGWQYQGLSPVHAADHVDVALAPLVTNSAFTFGYSLSQPALPARAYMPAAEAEHLAPLAYDLGREAGDRRMNVVIIMVESLGREYLSAISGEAAYMPFLDSLCGHALVFTNAFANSEGSPKGNCAVLAGIPSFTDEAFMNTPYAANRVEGLGTRLKELGYSTAYMHGGLNGEFKFDSFSKACGFDAYFGKDEFGDDRFYDGHWGIYDEEFLQYAAGSMSAMPEPFCAAVFTLTTHDPFPVPPRYKGRFPKGDQEIHESLGYADWALRRFFERAQQEPWYRNTVFVITADHTFKYNDHPAWYMNPAGRFAIPILFFTPDGSLSGTDSTVAQQLDILPSVLDLVGYEGRVGAFGRSLFRNDRPGRAIIHLGGVFKIIEGDRMLLFDGMRAKGLFDYQTDTLFSNDLTAAEPGEAARMERVLRAYMQQHADALLHNRMVPEPLLGHSAP